MYFEGLCSDPSVICTQYCEEPGFKDQEVLGSHCGSVIPERMILTISFPICRMGLAEGTKPAL